MNIFSNIWNGIKAWFAGGRVDGNTEGGEKEGEEREEEKKEEPIVRTNDDGNADEVEKEEMPKPKESPNPFTLYVVQKLIVKHADHWTFRRLLQVSRDFYNIGKHRDIKITNIRVVLDDGKLALQTFDDNHNSWMLVQYEISNIGTRIRIQGDTHFVRQFSFEEVFLDDFIHILKHRNTTQLEALEFDIHKNDEYKRNLACNFLHQENLIEMEGAIEVKQFSMNMYGYEPRYCLSNLLKLMKPGVLEVIHLRFCQTKEPNDGPRAPGVEQFENILENRQWMEAKHLICRDESLKVSLENYTHFEIIEMEYLTSDDVSDFLTAFINHPPLRRCTVTVDHPIELDEDYLDILIDEPEILDGNLIFPIRENRVLLVQIEEFRIIATVENAV